jgi:hypothetical protein
LRLLRIKTHLAERSSGIGISGGVAVARHSVVVCFLLVNWGSCAVCDCVLKYFNFFNIFLPFLKVDPKIFFANFFTPLGKVEPNLPPLGKVEPNPNKYLHSIKNTYNYLLLITTYYL